VHAFKVTRTHFAEEITASGTVVADEQVDLRAQSSGRIRSIGFSEGAHVAGGALLIKLGDTELQALRRRTLHRRDLARLRERRLSALIEQKLVRQEEYDAALSECGVQDAELAMIDAQIAETEIRAPFDGIIGLRHVSEGAFVTNSSRLATLQSIRRVKVDFPVAERHAPGLRVDAPVQVTTASGERTFGRIHAVDPSVDTLTRTYTVRAIVPNDEQRLHPGGAVEVRLSLGETDQALFVPADAIVSSAAGKHVFVIENELAQDRPVQSVNRAPDSVQIISGLREGEIVVTSGLQALRPGARVAIAALTQSPSAT
jgi:membrane fusion protein (multidrug efflux system)